MKENILRKGLVLGIIILFVGASFTPVAVIGGQPPNEEWNKTYGGINSDEIGEWVEQTNDGGYIIAGRTESSGLYDAWLIKTNDNGDIVWNKVYHGSGNAWVEYVQQTTDGGYIAAGTISGNDGWLIKTDAEGNMTWNRVFDDVLNEGPIHRAWQTTDGGYILVGTAHGKVWLCKTDTNGYVTWSKTFSDWGGHGYSVQQTNDGGYILVGLAYLSGGGEDARLVKTDANGNTIWSKYYGGSNSDAGHSVRQTAEGGYIIGGVTTSYGSGTQDVWLIKTDSSGTELWNNTYGGSDNSWCHTVQLTNDGGYILSGSCNYQYKVSCDFCLIKTDVSGNEEWNKTFGGTGLDIGRAVQQIADGGYILVGETTSFGAGSKDVWLIKVALENQPPECEWMETYGGSDRDYGYSVQQTLDGGYVITGSTYSYGNGLRDVWLIKTDSNGNEEWNRTFGGANNDIGHYVQQTIDGGYIITGYTESYGPLHANVWLIKIDSNGSEEWNRTFGSYRVEIGYSVQQTSDGGFIITGSYQEGWTGTNVWLIKTDSNGTTEWSKGFGGRDTGDMGYCVQQTDDGGYIIVGEGNTYGAGHYDLWLIKTDSNGNWMWDKSFGGKYSDEGRSVQQTSDGGYVVTGKLLFKNAYGYYDEDVWLIKTNSSGGEEWSKTYGGTDRDYGYSVQQTLDGGYVITGSTLSYGNGSHDVWLIKTDTDGNEEWNITIGGTSGEVGRSVQQTTDGGYIITGTTSSYGSGLSDVWLIKLAGENQPPICAIELQKDDVTIDTINVGEFFDIYVGDSTGDIKQVRFSSDESQDDNPPDPDSPSWTDWYDWEINSGPWNAGTKIMRWSFDTFGPKKVWAEVNDTDDITDSSSANIYAGDIPATEKHRYGLFGVKIKFINRHKKEYIITFKIINKDGSIFDISHFVTILPEQLKIARKSFKLTEQSRSAHIYLDFNPQTVADLIGLTDFKINITYLDEEDVIEYEEFSFNFWEFTNIVGTNFNMTKDAYSFSNNDLEGDGKCFGMALTSILYYNGELSIPNDKEMTYDLTIEEAEPNITEYQEKFWLNDYNNIKNKIREDYILKENEYKKIKESIRNGNPLILMLAGGGKDAHAVVVYKIIEDENEQMSYLMVYDNIYEYNPYRHNAFKFVYYDLNTKWLSYEGYTEFKLISAKKESWLDKISSFSPIELRVFDSQCRLTGLLDGEPQEEIPLSFYDEENETVVIFHPSDYYHYVLKGTDDGVYGLIISHVEEGVTTNFTAVEIPVTLNTTHNYTINWTSLSQSDEGATIRIDSDGDGIFEKTITSDEELTQDEFIL
ncbi:MAG: hypothetical protein KAJ44_04505, partial [Thermoplasmatales archaeon]|nr:hypothetical protein [Thermoplasmatales archaeon]